MRKLFIISMLALIVLACNLSAPEPTTVIVTATPAPIDLEKDIVGAPASWWMDLEIMRQYPNAEIGQRVGVERGVRLYRAIEDNGERYIVIFEQGVEKWELVGRVKINATPTPAPPRYMQGT